MRVSELGFTAFLILRGYELKKYKDNSFYFEVEREVDELRIEWVNSDFAKFDKLLLDLKRFKTNNV